MEHFSMNLRFGVPASKLYQAIAADGAKNWWSRFVTGGSNVGDVLHFRFPKAGFFAKMQIAKSEPDSLVEWQCLDACHPKESGWSDLKDWQGTSVRFAITPDGDAASRLRFEHVGLTPELECHGTCSSTWAYYLNDSLRGYLEQGAGKPYADDSEDNIVLDGDR